MDVKKVAGLLKAKNCLAKLIVGIALSFARLLGLFRIWGPFVSRQLRVFQRVAQMQTDRIPNVLVGGKGLVHMPHHMLQHDHEKLAVPTNLRQLRVLARVGRPHFTDALLFL